MQSLVNNSNDYSAEFERRFYQKTAYQNSYEPVFYYVKPGDTLSQIITSYYDIRYGTKEYDYALLQVLFNNKHITNPNSIQPRQVISLLPMTPRYGVSMCLEEDAAQQDFEVLRNKAMNNNSVMAFRPNDSATQQFLSSIPSDPQERDMFWTLAWLQSNYDILLSTGAATATNVLGGLAGEQNSGLIKEVDKLYTQYQNKKLTKSQYDYKRRQVLKSYSRKVGPVFEKAVFNGQTTQQAIRINRTKALPANANILKYAGRLNELAKLASKGGLILTGFGVVKGAYDMCQAETLKEKNEIFVETAVGSSIGVISGLVLTGVLIANPLFWGGVLILGTIAAVGSYAAGKSASKIYNLSSDPIDFVSLTKAEAVCNLGFKAKSTDNLKSFDSLRAL
ncbi:LysM peptidoglycan-binding domain-containing protein [Marinomonas gallaica]|uniref:LysM peptidoglycan-binding domain-containing protein n=1 Tax=Marinomonas gallaica TaxID=1806667 RepID=UPI003A9576A4